MLKQDKARGLAALLAAVALTAAACGSSSNDNVSTPVNDAPPSDDAAPRDDATTDGAASTGVSGVAVDGGLTVSEALATDATGILAVQGFLFDDGSGMRLCQGLAESFPPQCMEPSISLADVDLDQIAEVEQAQGVDWTNSSITVFGELVDGTLVVDPLVAG